MDFRGISVLVLTAESIEKGGLALTQYLTIAKLALYHWAMPLLRKYVSIYGYVDV